MLVEQMNHLKDVVDVTVVIESTHTISGKPKELYYKSVDGFDVIHLVDEQEPSSDPWINEFRQRDLCLEALRHCDDYDAILINDVDEFPDPETLELVATGLSEPCTLVMKHYQGTRKCRINKPWPGTVVAPYFSLKEYPPSVYRDNRGKLPLVANGGEHLSFFGGIDQIIYKLESYTHVEHDNEKYKNRERIERCLREGLPILLQDTAIGQVV